jgi:predicted RNase H-like nuclease/ppGpp synthetase/RelA/SpoT-type nucleotidyltranferase
VVELDGHAVPPGLYFVIVTAYLGIDLAWGTKQPTGLAVLDGDARLLHLSTVRTDDEIVAALTPYLDPPVRAGIDAPLVVTNATGSRPAEQALSRDFRRYEAGTHPANTGRPEFANGTRGARVAERLGLEVHETALEVYPHAAAVALFGLDKTLKYKAKPGRDVDLLRSELLRLMRLVETVVQPDATWVELRGAVEAATRKSELRVAEDQVDAVVCAYVARYADVWPEHTTSYGDPATGVIVTPSLSADGGPGDPTGAAITAYADRHPELVDAAARAAALVAAMLDEAGINYLTVDGRAKAVASFAEKANRAQGGRLVYPDPLHDIGDQLGIRVITYVRDDVEAVAALLSEQLTVRDDRDFGELTASQGRFGYASRHLQVEIEGRMVQVQLRTVLQHAWAEFEHDIRYKGTVPAEHANEFDRRFTLAAGLLELADQEFSAIRDRLRDAEPSEISDDDPRIAPSELAAFLAGQYDDAGWSRSDHYAWISRLLLELGVTTLVELAELLRSTDEEVIRARMDYRYPPGAVRRLDDALLYRFGEQYVALHGNAHRRELLTARLARLRGEDQALPPAPGATSV